jgi:sulfhydrogenase subunit gamma (sulfur reductase)
MPQPDIGAATQSSIYLPVMARLVKVEPLTELESLFTLQLPYGRSLRHEPGQFVECSLMGIGEAPFAVTSSPSRTDATFELCIRRVGDVTNALHRLVPGDVVGIRGPFGQGFPIGEMRGKDLLFAAGGMGLPPLRSLVNQVLDERGAFGRVIILYGTNNPRGILFREEIKQWSDREDVEFHLTVDRAERDWQGKVGVITTLFPQIHVNPRNTVAVTCGPPVMYRFILMELLGKGIPETRIYLSLERRMKCGIGKCGHCQINHLTCCQDGPVFTYARIKHVEEAL